MKKKSKPNKYLAIAVSELLIKHIEDTANNTVTDDPDLAKLKDYLLWKILNKSK